MKALALAAMIWSLLLVQGASAQERVPVTTIQPVSIAEYPWLAPPVFVTESVFTKTAGRLEINQGSWYVAKAQGKSMIPAIGDGSLVLLEPSTDSPPLGAFIAYRCGEIILHHQVIRQGTDERGWFALTKGLNNRTSDFCVARAENMVAITRGVFH